MSTDATPQDIVILSLGPVQSYVETARRTQDLAIGSRLLSVLAGAAMQAAVDSGAQEVFPQRLRGRWPASIPNRVVVTAAPGDGAAVASDMSRSAQAKWQHVAQEARAGFESLAGNGEWKSRWTRQAAEWLETYWVVWPWNGQSYASAYQQASMALEARKNVRHYPVQPQLGQRCTLCGVRSALGTERALWRRVRSRVWTSRLRPGERLCAVCACKRFPPSSVGELQLERFPSTSSIASASFRAALLQDGPWERLGDAVLAHLDAVDTLGLYVPPDVEPSEHLENMAGTDEVKRNFLRYDGDYFYPSFFSEARVREALGQDELSGAQKQGVRHAAGTLRTLLIKARQAEISSPFTYFATLALDGDHMGRLLGEAQGLEAHRQISSALAEFAEGPVRRIVEEQYPGQVVYAGGDDLLALLPLDCALSVADALRSQFALAMRQAGWPDRTASAGLAIVHHQHPLSGAIRAAREAQKVAKDEGSFGRNALVVECLRRSGEPRQVGRNWPATAEADPDVVDRVRDWMAEGRLAGKFAYDLAAEADALSVIPEAHTKEIGRLLKRHSDAKLWPDGDMDRQLRDLAEGLASLAAQLPTLEGATGIEQLGNWLILARFLAQGGRE